ncbi:MAG: tetratricopeptide repeat protein [Burkholderiales bacterium]
MRLRTRLLGAALGAVLCGAAPLQAQEKAPGVGSGLTFSGAPTMQEILAQQKACEARKPPRKGAGTIGELTFRRLERIMVAVVKGEYVDSEKKLLELSENVSGDYEKAVVMQTLAYVYAMQNKHGQSIKAYEEALATGALPQQQHEQMMLNVAQLYLSINQDEKGVQALNKYIQESCNPTPDAHIMLGSIYADRKQWRDSLKHTDLALIKAKAPKESWLQLKLALHFELKEFPACSEVLVALIAMAPMKESYFKQLHGILNEIKRDNDALAVLALAERRGFVDEEPEFRLLSDMYMLMEIPVKAAQVLERGLAAKKVEPNEKNLERLANAWFQAREYGKSEAAMARAAQASGKGELWKQLASIQMEKEDWQSALESLKKAKQKGGNKNPGEVDFLTGVSATRLKQWKTAETALRAAMEHEKYVKQASEWLNHMREEYAYNNPDNGNGAEPAGDGKTQTN